MAIRELEDRARKCYAATTGLVLDRDPNQFVEMMLLDGFFIIELFRKFMGVELIDENDHIFQSEQILFAIGRDLILLENQLPFFILNRLFDMTNSNSNLGIIQIAPQNKLQAPSGISINNIKHLLDLVHRCWCGISTDNIKHLLDLLNNWWCSTFAKTNRNVTVKKKWEFMRSATELQEAGVQFQKSKGGNLFDVKFISGTLEIPLLLITDYTESFLTNLVAFELCPSYHKPKYVCDYIVFMDCLINSSKDVRLLTRSGIIESWVGDDVEVYSMWHKLFKITITDLKNFGYSEVFVNVNNHGKRRRNVWMAYLKRNYFNSPWALISFLAATILLLLTVAQTIFSILSFG